MTDADGFLQAIRADPADDVRRLAFADWLDENATCPVRTATAEFVRLTHARQARAYLPAAAGRWLYRHWRRLVPALAAYVELHQPAPKWPELGAWLVTRRKGRWLHLSRYARYATASGLAVDERTDRADVEFARGFVGRVVCRDWRFADVVLPLLLDDQPLVAPELTSFGREWEVTRQTYDPTMFRRLYAKDGRPLVAVRVSRDRVGPCFDHLVATSAMTFHEDRRRLREVDYHPGPRNDAAARARADVARALLVRARLVLSGKAQAGVDPRAAVEASEPLVEALGGG